MASLKIIRATPRHVEPVVPLFLGYLDFYRQPVKAARVRRFLKDRLRRKESVIFLALLNGEPVGFAQLYPTFASLALRPAWILYDLFVEPGIRRAGVATALLARAHRLGVATQASELMLETATTNRAAQRLYKKMGWQREAGFYVYRRKIG